MKIDILIYNKRKNVFIKYTEILEKVSNIIKIKFNSELMYSKRYLKAEKNEHKRRLPMVICNNNID